MNVVVLFSSFLIISIGSYSHAAAPVSSAGTIVSQIPDYMLEDDNQVTQTDTSLIVKEITKRLQAKLTTNSPYKLSPEQVTEIAKASENPAFSEAIQAIANSDAKDPLMVRINQVRLEIIAAIGNLSVTSTDAGVRDLGILATGVKPNALNAESQGNLVLFLETVKAGMNQDVPTEKLLQFAKTTLENGEGKKFDIEYIQKASQRKAGVNAIFFSRTERRVYRIGEYTGQEGSSKPIELVLNVPEADALEAAAQAAALELIEQSLSPQGREILRQKAAAEVTEGLEQTTEQVGVFLKGNKILNQSTGKFKDIEDQRFAAVKNIDDLLRLLKEIGHAVGENTIRGKTYAALRAIPVAGLLTRRFVPDPINALKTHRSKIEEVDRNLLANAETLKVSLAEIQRVLQSMGTHMQNLKLKIATNRIIADRIRQTARGLIAQGRTEEANQLESGVGLRIERALTNGQDQTAALQVIIEAMNQQVDASTLLREDINGVRNVVMQIFSASEMVKKMAETLKMISNTNKAVRAAAEGELAVIRQNMKETNDLVIEIKGQPIINAEKIDELATFLVGERQRVAAADLTSKRNLEKHNAKMTDNLNKMEELGIGQVAFCAGELNEISGANGNNKKRN